MLRLQLRKLSRQLLETNFYSRLRDWGSQVAKKQKMLREWNGTFSECLTRRLQLRSLVISAKNLQSLKLVGA